MKLKAIISAAIVAAASLPAFAAAPTVAQVSPYVYPENRVASVPNFTYMPDGNSYLTLAPDHRSVVRFDTKTGNQLEVYLDLNSTRESRLEFIDGFAISADASKVMVWTNTEYVYRRSFTAEYYIYDTHSRLLRPLSSQHARQQSPLISPNGRMVAFVADNNIYIKKLDYNSEVAVTADGAPGSIINGIPDWVYEEEFTTTCSMTWAPDNLNLCYLRYDESAVPTFDMQRYCGSCSPNPGLDLYPQTWSYKYPVAGQVNSVVTLHSYDVETRKVKTIDLPDNRIEYIPAIAYGPDENSLIVATLNREQNHYEIYKVNPKSTVCKSLYVEDSKTWITPESYENLHLGADGFVVLSWRNGRHQLYKYNYNGVETGQIAPGDYDITAYYGCDPAGAHIFQVAAPNPRDRVIRRIDAKGRITDISPSTGDSQATFSPDMRWMLLCHSTSSTVPVYTLATNEGKAVRTIQDNAAAAARLQPLAAPREFFTMTSDGATLQGFIIKPTDFDPARKYPTVMYQYSGPGSQEVRDRWRIDWYDAFARAGYVVICVDPRGSGFQGRKFCDQVYGNLGYYETIDQIAAARYAASLPYVDADRMAIFGWSYGGYETLMVATDPACPFKAAVAVAPVTDWRFYDSVYAERYLNTPQQNENGYHTSAPLNRAANLQCQLLIMHGTADDNVHPNNSLEFISRLQAAGLLCDLWLFPNMNHSINFCNGRALVYAKMLDWLNRNL